MRTRSLVVIALLALGAFLAACGSDSSTSTTVNEKVVLPAEQVAAKDGAKAHSESDIVECSTMDSAGTVGTASFGGFQDISVKGLTCEDARQEILDIFKTFDGENVSPTVGDFSCAVIERLSGGLNTIRCTSSNGNEVRFTAVPKKRRIPLVHECGSFGRFYDVSALGQDCQTVATFLDNTPTEDFTSLPDGKVGANVGSQVCKVLYTSGRDKTIRCQEGEASMRFSIAERPSRTHPKHYPKPKKLKPPAPLPLNPAVITSCSAVGPFDAITAKGIDCTTVTSLLQDNTSALEQLEAGGPSAQIGPPDFTCSRIDSGGETATVECTGSAGASFRASFIPASGPTPAPLQPPTTSTEPPPADTGPPDSGTGTGPADDGSGGGPAPTPPPDSGGGSPPDDSGGGSSPDDSGY